ncbi:MAG: hypothetical protein DMG13_17180 [Acidobacteria bacterium]|nr:MAG: hypothetical protein DMG13_17180 [Acidobacteriota bacterium]
MSAETQQNQKTSTTPRVIRVAGWTISGSLRLRFEDWDFFKAQSGDSSYGYGASLLRVSIGRQFRSQDWLFEFAQPSLIGLPSAAIAPSPQGQLGFGGTYRAANPDRTVGFFLKQAFVRLKGIGGDQPSTLRIGRFEFGDGLELNPEGPLGAIIRDRVANRPIGNFGFTHVGRSLDGIHFSRGASSANFTFLAARPTEGVFQVKGTKELNVEIVSGAFTKTHRSAGEGEGRVFATYYRDGRDVLKTDNRPLPLRSADHKNINITAVGGNYVNVFALGAGKADALLWRTIQTGTWGTLVHRANAFAAEAGYQLNNVRLKPWLRGGYFRGSGDDDPSDGVHRTFFQELPTPRPFARFPLYNLMNNEDTFVQLSVTPHRKLRLRSEADSLNLANASDLWYVGGGAFQKQTFGYTGRPSAGEKGFATVFDVSADFQFDAQTTFTLYMAHASGKGVVEHLNPDGPTANFAYVELNRRF